ncbi:hypothetical protein ACR9E3_09880 [Actinomycetospora sp. C-140]
MTQNARLRIEISRTSLVGLSVVALVMPELRTPLNVRVVEMSVALIIGRLVRQMEARDEPHSTPPRLDLDDLIARAESIKAGRRDQDETLDGDDSGN